MDRAARSDRKSQYNSLTYLRSDASNLQISFVTLGKIAPSIPYDDGCNACGGNHFLHWPAQAHVATSANGYVTQSSRGFPTGAVTTQRPMSTAPIYLRKACKMAEEVHRAQ